MAEKRKMGNDSTLPGTSSNSEATSAKLYKDGGGIQEDTAKKNDERQVRIFHYGSKDGVKISLQKLLKERVISYWKEGNDLHASKCFKDAKMMYAKAMKCIEEITDVNFKNRYFWVVFNIALELKEHNELQEALSYCNIACASKYCSKKKEVFNLRGLIHSSLGQYGDAVKDFRASLYIQTDLDTMESLKRNQTLVKIQSSRFKFYNALRITKNCTPGQIKKAIAKLRANLENGEINPGQIKQLTKLVSKAELVLLDPNLKMEYDRGTGIMDVKEYYKHPEFYYFPPI